MYSYPNGINNSNGNSNRFGLNVCCNSTGLATLSIINAVVADCWNGIDTIVTLTCTGGADSIYSNGSRMMLDVVIIQMQAEVFMVFGLLWQSLEVKVRQVGLLTWNYTQNHQPL